jgi:hypothetical protein
VMDRQALGPRAQRSKGSSTAVGFLGGGPGEDGLFRLPGPKDDAERYGEPGSADSKEFIIPPALQQPHYTARAWTQASDVWQPTWKEPARAAVGGGGGGSGYDGMLHGFAPDREPVPLSPPAPVEYGLRHLLFSPGGGAQQDSAAAPLPIAAAAAGERPNGSGGAFEGFEGHCDWATGLEHLVGGGEGPGGGAGAGLFALQASIVNMAIDDDNHCAGGGRWGGSRY